MKQLQTLTLDNNGLILQNTYLIVIEKANNNVLFVGERKKGYNEINVENNFLIKKQLDPQTYQLLIDNGYNMSDITDEHKAQIIKEALIIDVANNIYKLDESKLTKTHTALYNQEHKGDFHQKGRSYRYTKDNQKILIGKQLMVITNQTTFGGDHIVKTTNSNTTTTGDQELTIIVPKENAGSFFDGYNINKYQLIIDGNPKTDMANSKLSYIKLSTGTHPTTPPSNFTSKTLSEYWKGTNHSVNVENHSEPYLMKYQGYNGDSGLFEIIIDFSFLGIDPSNVKFKSKAVLTYTWKGDIDPSRVNWIEQFTTRTRITSLNLLNANGDIELKITIPANIKPTHLKILHKISQGLGV